MTRAVEVVSRPLRKLRGTSTSHDGLHVARISTTLRNVTLHDWIDELCDALDI